MKTTQETSTQTWPLFSSFYFLLSTFCATYYCFEVPRILLKIRFSSFHEFPQWSFFLSFSHCVTKLQFSMLNRCASMSTLLPCQQLSNKNLCSAGKLLVFEIPECLKSI